MRFDTQRISAQLVTELQRGRPHLEAVADSGGLIRVALESNEVVHIYLLENPLAVPEIRGIVAANTAVGVYSLFILWCDLLLPAHGARCHLTDWMQALLALHGDRIYAYDADFGAELFIFPIYFEGVGGERLIRHGAASDVTRLRSATVATQLPDLVGVWRVAGFEAPAGISALAGPLSHYYRRLGLADDAGRAAVKRAYRRLARQYHPDLNADDPAATTRMQAINEAYQRILEDLDERTPTHGE